MNMTMLLELPQDLLVCVLSEWLVVGLKDLSVLDVAIGSSSRLRKDHWLPLLADLGIPQSKLPISICPSLKWIHDRKLQVAKIVVQMAAVNSLDGVSLPFVFASTSTVAFDGKNFSANPFGLRELLVMFPNVTAIAFTDCPVVDGQLLELLDLPLGQLRELNLVYCENITAAAVAAVVRHYSATLESLLCDVLDDNAVKKMSRCCRGLTKVNWSLDMMESPDSLLELCSQHPKLSTIKFKSRRDDGRSAVCYSFAESISLLCPLIQEIWLEPADSSDYSMLPMIIANCKMLKIVAIGEAHVWVFQAPSGGKYCDIQSLSEHPHAEHTLEMLTALTLPIRQFCGLAAHNYHPINRQALRLLANSASTLEDVRIALMEDVCPEDLQHFFTSCSNLTILKLCGLRNSKSLLDDDAIRRLPSQCPKLKVVDFNYCAPYISTQAAIDMLLRYRGNSVIQLAFKGCLSLTNKVLDTMDELFPNLRQVSVKETSVTKEGALAFVLRRRISPLRFFTAPSYQDQAWIEQQLAERAIRISRLKFVYY